MEKIKKILDSESSFKAVLKPESLYVILINGRRVKMNSGKAIWSGLGPAKLALKNHISGLVSGVDYEVRDDDGKIDWVKSDKLLRSTIDEWINKNVVFATFSSYMELYREGRA